MTETLNIPLTTLAPGTYNFPASGGVTIADTDTELSLTISRTVTGGLNSLTTAVAMQLTVFQSNDGGVTWQENGSCTFNGGIQGDHGVVDTISGYSTGIFPGTSRQLRGQVIVSGGSVAVQGSLTAS